MTSNTNGEGKILLVVGDPGVPNGTIERELQHCGLDHDVYLGSESVPMGRAGDVEVLVSYEHVIGREELEQWPRLKCCSCAFTGINAVRTDIADELGIQVFRVPDYATRGVVGLLLMYTLNFLYCLREAEENVRKGLWRKGGPCEELTGKCVGIVGIGTIGLEAARTFRSLGCEVVGWSRHPKTAFVEFGCRQLELTDVLSVSDIIVLQTSLTSDTEEMIGEKELAVMKHRAILLNAGRSELIEQDALCAALQRGDIRLGLDVYAEEPVSAEERVFQYEGVIATPHIGCRTRTALSALCAGAIRNVARYYLESDQNRVVPPPIS